MLRFLTAGESHGPALTVIIEGFPAGQTVDFEAIHHELERRQQGYGRGARMKIERDDLTETFSNYEAHMKRIERLSKAREPRDHRE